MKKDGSGNFVVTLHGVYDECLSLYIEMPQNEASLVHSSQTPLLSPSKMAPRRKPAAPTYSQLFGDGSGASSFGPSSSDAVPTLRVLRKFLGVLLLHRRCLHLLLQRLHLSLPQQVQFIQIYVCLHPDLRVPSYAPFARYTVEDFACPAWMESLEVLDPDRPPITFWQLEKTGVLPSLSELFKMTHATSDGVFVDPASEKLFHAVAARIEERETQLTQHSPDGLPVTLTTEEVDRIFEEVAPKKKGRTVGIGSVNKFARATSSYTSRQDEENSQMKARLDSQKRMLSERRAALGLPVRDPEESDPNRQQPSNPTDYFENM
uniref:Uncharacterized protein n=1 Tax=Brassica oleracea var. oleracea TaxID=109376 RepID=A0A0D3CDH0_BRAOL